MGRHDMRGHGWYYADIPTCVDGWIDGRGLARLGWHGMGKLSLESEKGG